jgi:hypothetical protein
MKLKIQDIQIQKFRFQQLLLVQLKFEIIIFAFSKEILKSLLIFFKIHFVF